MGTPVPPRVLTGFWQFFRKTFKKDPADLTRSQTTDLMVKRLRQRPIGVSIRKWNQERTDISRFVDRKTLRPQGLWADRVGMHSQLKDLQTRGQVISTRTKTGRPYNRTNFSWNKPELSTMVRYRRLSNKKLYELMSRKHRTPHTVSSVTTLRYRINKHPRKFRKRINE